MKTIGRETLQMSIKKNEQIFPECIFEEMFYIVAWNYNTNRNLGNCVGKSRVICTSQLAGGHLLKMVKYW